MFVFGGVVAHRTPKLFIDSTLPLDVFAQRPFVPVRVGALGALVGIS